jgi:gluconate kinase
MGVIMLSGPIGAGKTTVSRELIASLAAPLSYIEGDRFWSFIAKPDGRDRIEHFRVIMRAMTAAAKPFARAGYKVLLDFSIPPRFLDTARKILEEIPLDYIVLRPSASICEARASMRAKAQLRTTPLIATSMRSLKRLRTTRFPTMRRTRQLWRAVFAMVLARAYFACPRHCSNRHHFTG